MSRNFIDPEFTKQVQGVIGQILPSGSLQTVTRKELCVRMQMDPKDAGVFSRMLDFGLLEEFEDRGPVGIGRKGAPKPKSAELLLTEEFLSKLQAACEAEISFKKTLTREQLAMAMGSPGVETMEKISLAFKNKKVSGFTLKKGVGICRI